MDPLTDRALSLFNRARRIAGWRKAVCAFRRCNPALSSMRDFSFPSGYRIYHAGIRAVSLSEICGTLGRSSDFDRRFYPLADHVRDRWISIALARMRDKPVGLVRLYSADHCYLVADGHHRISVARALGELAIEAEIILVESLRKERTEHLAHNR